MKRKREPFKAEIRVRAYTDPSTLHVQERLVIVATPKGITVSRTGS